MAIPKAEQRILDFENMGFGMFIHYGLYSQMGSGEWIQHINKIPKEEYTKLADTFTAKNFDAKRIVRMAKDAGAKYITMTTRHHEGFSLYDTCGLSTYDVMHTPCKRDLVREFVDACHELGIKPFLYHTTVDWYNPDCRRDFPRYLQYLRDSVEILCTNYGEIGGFWFDGNWWYKERDWEEDKLYAVIRKHQPNAIIVNNTGGSARGAVGNPELDSVTFEQGRPTPMNREGMPKYLAAEMCHTMNLHWGFGSADFNYKSLASLIETLCSCRKVGANYLLNIGPTGDGDVPFMQEALLRGIGGWIRETGNAVYEGRPCEIVGDGKNFALRAGNKLYFFIHGLSIVGNADVTFGENTAGIRTFRGVADRIGSVRWTDDGREIGFKQDGEELMLDCNGYPYGKDLVVRIAEAELI
ncbi:MAG: alpha-L-fucosidase [Clostridia bacterium]|nr:alpha-L-fucosidase [Clostridia bacterium]